MEYQKFIEILTKLATNFPKQLDEMLISVYWESLRYQKAEVLNEAVNNLIRQPSDNRWFPTVGQIMLAVSEVNLRRLAPTALPEPEPTPEEVRAGKMAQKFYAGGLSALMKMDNASDCGFKVNEEGFDKFKIYCKSMTVDEIGKINMTKYIENEVKSDGK